MAVGIRTTEDFTPFRQIDDIFTRAFRDDSVRTKESDAFQPGLPALDEPAVAAPRSFAVATTGPAGRNG